MAANAESAISQGALRSIFNGEHVENPVFQCVQIKPLAAGKEGAVERFRVVFSDVNNFIQAMLATQLNYLVHENKFTKGCFVRIKQFQSNEVKGKKIIIVLDCDILYDLGERDKIGQPEALEIKEDGGVKKEENSVQPAGIASNGFYGNKPQEHPQQAQQQPQRSAPTRSNGANNDSSYGNIYPIEAISPYAHKWTIKARCTHKSDIKTWHNKNGEGRLFSVNFLDESGEIRGTGFNEAVDLLYEIFQEGGVYYISSPCRVQMAKKQFSNVNHDYELTFERDTQVERAEDEASVPKVQYNFTTLADIQSVAADSTIDTIGVLKEVGEVNQITSKTTSKPYDKRELTLVDSTNYSVRLTIWGNTATSFEGQPDSVVAFKGVKVSDFGGKSLSLLSSGSMNIDPDIDEAYKLKGWYDASGKQDNFTTHAAVLGTTSAGGRKDQTKTIQAVRDEQLGMSESVDYFTLKATVIYIKNENIAYPACQSEGCNKKVVNTDPGEWRCERCDKAWPKPEYRYILTVSVSDWTGQLWLSCFDDVGKLLTGLSANELMELKENDEKAFQDKIQDANCRTWVFRCRAKMDTFQDQQRVRYQVSSASPVNFSQEATKLAEMIKQYSIQDNSMFVN